MDAVLAQLPQSLASPRSLEELTRPLLQMLETVTGLESTYLTTIDHARGTQQVLFARNSRELQIPEGTTVTWEESLCRRALEEERLYTDDARSVWGDHSAVIALDLQTYISTPLHTAAGELYGTLCAASTSQRPISPEAGQVLQLFARLIEQQVSREQLVAQLQLANDELRTQALTDPLTGLLNRRALEQELERQRATARRAGHWLLVGALDLDGFKQVNDRHGHAAGDDLLRGVALALQKALRGGDVLARMGGDEFVIVGFGPQREADGIAAARLMQQRLSDATTGRYAAGGTCIDYPGASVGVACVDPQVADVEAALQAADAAMYRVKALRRRSA